MRLSVSVPAKVNLHLEVLGRRPDGFHELRTLLQSVDLCDQLVGETVGGGELTLEVEPAGAVEAGETNLALRAAGALRRATGERRGARLRLVKRIPVGAGLGGGSADAAAALVLLDRLWSLALDRGTLQSLAAGLGSDVPFFLHGGLALGVGRGEEVYPLPDLPRLGLLLAVPPVAVPTPEVYHRLALPPGWRQPDPTVYAFAAGLHALPGWDALHNDLQSVVVAGWPEVAEVVEALEELRPLHAAVTGSGSAAFALFAEPAQAVQAAGGVRGARLVHVGATLTRVEAALEPREL